MANWDDLKTDLNNYCKDNHGSMRELATHLDVHFQAVNRWLNEDVVPSYEVGKEMEKWLKGRK